MKLKQLTWIPFEEMHSIIFPHLIHNPIWILYAIHIRLMFTWLVFSFKIIFVVTQYSLNNHYIFLYMHVFTLTINDRLSTVASECSTVAGKLKAQLSKGFQP